ncbi:hypothetical protein GCM10011391_13470 [Pullulanibacillus camelliae]|uniref:Uncharacterized protein n=1 Tax=Pullulanibacillus camelliae TaxID=1707096 RepID=A0A8J2VP33_9BACL|nr:hypothetical protein GCM10011391_13470 [Pullulanibacillus camelliae]
MFPYMVTSLYFSHLRKPNDSTKDVRLRMGYTNNQLRMLLGYLDQLNGKENWARIISKRCPCRVR